jgi:spore maturation protein CgeB
MCGWFDGDIDLVHLPVAGNLVRAIPLSFSPVTDVAMVANFSHRESVMKQLIEPLFKRIDLLGYSYQAFGDEVWQLAGLNYNGPLVDDKNRLAIVYAAAKVCPNVHTEEQVKLQAFLNERSFTITLCGGTQVSDNPLATKYLLSHCLVATSTTDFMNKVIESIEDQSSRIANINAGVEYVANNHTYFNRLADIFQIAGFKEYSKEVEQKGSRAARRHCWEIGARTSAEERGIPYENEAIGAT